MDIIYIHVSRGRPINTTIAGGEVATPSLMKSATVSVMSGLVMLALLLRRQTIDPNPLQTAEGVVREVELFGCPVSTQWIVQKLSVLYNAPCHLRFRQGDW